MLNDVVLPEDPAVLFLPASAGNQPPNSVDALPDNAQICSCFDITKSVLQQAIKNSCHTIAALKQETKPEPDVVAVFH
ncbi:MAG: hypothetical protein XXXJIFNMEKO3_02977 [Candidatus Erwinia impunctatus]|nr:hypothetical protein XXXJIFNMEKO_02977 [Culicoides impunctatus]